MIQRWRTVRIWPVIHQLFAQCAVALRGTSKHMVETGESRTPNKI